MRAFHQAGRTVFLVLLMSLPALAAPPGKEDPDGHSIVTSMGGIKYNKRPAIRAAFPEIRDWSTLKITLARGPCLGSCPIYSVEIDGDGTVIYYGKDFVAVKAGRTDKIAKEAVQDLVASFRKAEFFWLFDGYDGGLSDGPPCTISIAFDGVSKSVLDHAGGLAGLPSEIGALEVEIDKLAGTAKWVRG